MSFTLWAGNFPLPGERSIWRTAQPEEHDSYEFTFDVTDEYGWSWRSKEPVRWLSSPQFADYLVQVFIGFSQQVAIGEIELPEEPPLRYLDGSDEDDE